MIRGRGRNLLAIILLASSCAAAKRLPVRVYTSADGLALDGIGCIVQDSRGFLWFCTSEGLSRFDGHEFTNYSIADGLPSNWIYDFLETRKGVYWVATSRGLGRLVELGDRLKQQSLRPGRAAALQAAPKFVKYNSSALARGQVVVLAEGPDGTVWCGGAHRLLYRMEGNPSHPVATAVDVDSHPESAGSDSATSLVVDRAGAVWMGTLNGLYRYGPGGRTRHYTVHDGLPENAIHSLYADLDGRLWIGTGAGLCHTAPNLSEGQNLIEHVYTTADGLPTNWINTILRSSDGRFWIGTGQGLAESVPDARRGGPQFRDLTAEVGIVKIGVDALVEDREGNLWLGTGGWGAIKTVRNGFSTYGEADGLPLAPFSAVFEDRLGELCLVGGPNALWHLDGERFSRVQIPLPSGITYFGWGSGQIALQDHTGDWWIATGQGLCRFRAVAGVRELGRARLIHVYSTRDGLAGNNIFRIFEDSRGDIWISTSGPDSLARWDRTTNSIHDWPGWARSDHAVTGFVDDRAGNLWMSLWEGGFLRYRDGRLEQFPPGGEVAPGLRESLLIDRKGRLWAGGYGGLCRIDRPAAEHPQFVTYGPAQGLSSTFVSSVAEGPQGEIFVANRRGVDRLEPESGRIRHYTAADGLAPGEPALLFCDRHGTLWVTTRSGVSQLVPQPGPRRSPPSVLITGLRVRSLLFPVSAHGEASIAEFELKPNENQLAIDFAGPSFAAGEALRYQYRLAGADRDWSAPTDQRTVNYASLSSGSYRFLVRAISADGLTSPEPAVVSFRILPPIWLRWWFLALAATLIGLAGYALYRYRLGHLLELERVRTRIATDLHDDIGTSLSGMAFLSEAVKQQIGDRHSAASEMAGEVAATARGLADALGDVVWSIDPRRGDLGNLIMHVRWFASRVLEAQGIAWMFQAPPAPEKVKLAPEQRRHLLLIFKEAINNIARHARCASVTFAISVADHRLEAEIQDDGRGFDPRPGPERPDAHAGGNGLGNMRLRAAQLGGRLDIDSAHGRGTRLKLTVPLG